MVRKAFTLSTPSAFSASRTLSSQCIIRLLASGKLAIGKKIVAGIFGDYVKIAAAYKLLEPGGFTSVSQQIKPLRRLPQRAELCVIYEHIGRTRRIRSIFKVVGASV